jgi:hypothetical protein
MSWVVLIVALPWLLPEGVACARPAERLEARPPRTEKESAKGRALRAFWGRVLELRSRLTVPVPVNVYRPDPNVRMEQLLFESEDLRQIHDEVRRFWMNDQPAHQAYQRVHGGIGP